MLALNGKDLASAGQHFKLRELCAGARSCLGGASVTCSSRQASGIPPCKRSKGRCRSTRRPRGHTCCSRMPTHSSQLFESPGARQRAEEYGSENAAPARNVARTNSRGRRKPRGRQAEFEAVARDFQTHSAPPSPSKGCKRLYNPDARETSGTPGVAAIVGSEAALLPARPQPVSASGRLQC